MKLSYAALIFATKAHASINQVRKYTGDPYIVHPISVASILEECGVEGDLSKAVAYLHDVLEDVAPLKPEFGRETIEKEFGKLVASMVSELTDVYTKEDFPSFNRAKRKDLEAARLSTISATSMEVKMADLIDNTVSISEFLQGLFKREEGVDQVHAVRSVLVLY